MIYSSRNFVLVCIAALGGAACLPETTPDISTDDQIHVSGAVTRVVDGDSLYIASVATQIRLFGVDAPERDEDGYAEATKVLKSVALGEHTTCRVIEHDRYGRIIGRCTVNGVEINRHVIHNGPATEYCRYSKNAYGTC